MNENQTIEIHNRFDIIEARMQVRTLARKLGLDLFDQARISLAASTVAIILGLESSGNGSISMERRQFGERVGVEVVCTKADAKLPNLAAGVMDDAKRMVDELTIKELPSHGIEVTLFKWGKTRYPGDLGRFSS
jgi:hypothetical protein